MQRSRLVVRIVPEADLCTFRESISHFEDEARSHSRVDRGPVLTLSVISRPPIDALLDATSATIAAPTGFICGTTQ